MSLNTELLLEGMKQIGKEYQEKKAQEKEDTHIKAQNNQASKITKRKIKKLRPTKGSYYDRLRTNKRIKKHPRCKKQKTSKAIQVFEDDPQPGSESYQTLVDIVHSTARQLEQTIQKNFAIRRTNEQLKEELNSTDCYDQHVMLYIEHQKQQLYIWSEEIFKGQVYYDEELLNELTEEIARKEETIKEKEERIKELEEQALN